jgi:hypothetical protein
MHVRFDACEFSHVQDKEVPMPDHTPWQWLRQHGLAVFLAVVAIVLFLLFSGYLTG